jgi:hypothetical protein
MPQLNLEIVNNLPVVRHDKHVILVGTGSPTTIHETNRLSFLGMDYPVQTQYAGANLPALRNQTGIPNLTTLLGMDVLSGYKVVFDYAGLRMVFDSEPVDFDGSVLPLELIQGIPVLLVECQGRNIKMFLESGAKLSYIAPGFSNGLPPQGVVQDYYPGLGAFETQTYHLDLHTGGVQFQLRCGNLPAQLRGLLDNTGVQGIIGSDFFHRFKACLDASNRLLYVS